MRDALTPTVDKPVPLVELVLGDGEEITAVVALNGGASATEEEIGETVKANLAGFKRPRTVVFVEQVRRGPNGKADYAWAKETAREFLGL